MERVCLEELLWAEVMGQQEVLEGRVLDLELAKVVVKEGLELFLLVVQEAMDLAMVQLEDLVVMAMGLDQ